MKAVSAATKKISHNNVYKAKNKVELEGELISGANHWKTCKHYQVRENITGKKSGVWRGKRSVIDAKQGNWSQAKENCHLRCPLKEKFNWRQMRESPGLSP